MLMFRKEHNKIVNDLQKELAEAKDLKELLNEITTRTGIPPKEDGNNLLFSNENMIGWSAVSELELGDKYPVYVDDLLGGKVIKQEATQVIKISSEGVITHGLTKQEPDKGYKYKLIR